LKPLKTIYWVRALLGLAAGILCTVYVFFTAENQLGSYQLLLTGVSFAILLYIGTYYVLKPRYLGRLEKPSKLLTQGIGIYFIAWLVSWTLIVTLMLPTISVSIHAENGAIVPENEEFWIGLLSGGRLVQNVTTLKIALVPPGTYVLQLHIAGYVVGNQNQTLTLDWLTPVSVEFNVTTAPARFLQQSG
jgi:hypothetical protein